jgi:hypothetical protein
MPTRRWLFLALWFSVATGACTHAPWNPHRGWTRYDNGNVELYTDAALEPKLTLDYLDASYEVLSRTFFRDDQVPPVRVLHVSTPSVSPLSTADGGYRIFAAIGQSPAASGSGAGSGRSTHAGALLMVGDTGKITHYAHAMAHHFIQSALPKAPLWLHEGLASYASRFRSEPSNDRILCFGTTQPADARYVVEPLDKLFSLSWQDYNDTMGPNIDGTAWGFVDYLLHGEEGKLRGRFKVLLRQLGSGLSTEEALRMVYPELRRDTLDQRFQDHMRTPRPKQLCPVSLPVGPGSGRKHATSKAPVPEAEMKSLFDGLEALPIRRGFADYFPP